MRGQSDETLRFGEVIVGVLRPKPPRRISKKFRTFSRIQSHTNDPRRVADSYGEVWDIPRDNCAGADNRTYPYSRNARQDCHVGADPTIVPNVNPRAMHFLIRPNEAKMRIVPKRMHQSPVNRMSSTKPPNVRSNRYVSPNNGLR